MIYEVLAIKYMEREFLHDESIRLYRCLLEKRVAEKPETGSQKLVARSWKFFHFYYKNEKQGVEAKRLEAGNGS